MPARSLGAQPGSTVALKHGFNSRSSNLPSSQQAIPMIGGLFTGTFGGEWCWAQPYIFWRFVFSQPTLRERNASRCKTDFPIPNS